MKKTVFTDSETQDLTMNATSQHGTFRIQVVIIPASKTTLHLIDDNYAKLNGYRNRQQLLIKMNASQYSDLQLYRDPATNLIHTIMDVKPCLN